MPRILRKVKFLPGLLMVGLAVFCPGVVDALDRPTTVAQASAENAQPDSAADDGISPATTTQVADRTRKWVLDQLQQTLSSRPDLSQIASMLYGLVNDPAAVEHPYTRKALAELGTFVGAIDRQALDCGNLVSLRFIGSFLGMAGIDFDAAGLDRHLYDCLEEMSPFDRTCALFVLCHFPSSNLPRKKLLPAVKSIEALQQADGSFGSGYGLQRYYLTTHAVFALHACQGTPDVVQRGQRYLRNELPAIRQAGFLDGLLESLIMLRKMGVTIPDEQRYTDFLKSRIMGDGSICFFDQPACRSNVHATSLLLEFLREFGD